jgi:hypothetical protein
MLKHNIQERGILSFVNFEDLDYYPQRIMLMYGVPKGEIRGNHGHRKDRHLITCVSGKVKVDLTTKDGTETHILNPGDSVLQEIYVWGVQEYLEENTTMVVLCSEKFDSSEYINDIKEILDR